MLLLTTPAAKKSEINRLSCLGISTADSTVFLGAFLTATSSCAQVCVRTLKSDSKMVKSLRWTVLALSIFRHSGGADSISTASMVPESPELYDNSMDGCG